MKYIKLFEKFENVNLYHGSDTDFENFETDKISTGDASELFGKGFYLTSNYNIAKHYAILKVKQQKIISYQKGIFDTPVPVYSEDSDEYAEKNFKINKFKISGNILNVDSYIMTPDFLDKLKKNLY